MKTDSKGTDFDRASADEILMRLRRCNGRGLEIDLDRAQCVAELADVIGQERAWTRYIGQSGLMSARHALNLRQVHTRFSAQRDDWISVDATITTLIMLLPASDDLIETVRGRLANGERVTTRALKQWVAEEAGIPAAAKNASRLEAGGGQALARLAMTVAKSAAANFLTHVERIDSGIRAHITQKADGSLAVAKAKVVAAVQLDARIARRIYETTFVTFVPHEHFDGARCYSLATAGGGRHARRAVGYLCSRAR